jgi:hypothetical protein
MNLCVIKLGQKRINFNGDDTGTGEVISIIKLLLPHNYITYLTEIVGGDIHDQFETKHFDINDYDTVFRLNNFDALIILNGLPNFNNKNSSDITKYRAINSFKGRKFYIYCDPSLILYQMIDRLSFYLKTNKNYYSLQIKNKDITYISQPYNIHEVDKLIYNTKHTVKPDKIIHYPLYKFPFYTNERSKKLKGINDFEGDLVYGGSTRFGRREDKIIEYYCNYPNNFLIKIFGNITEKSFSKKKAKDIIRYPIFEEKINYDKFIDRMSNFMATVSIGDEWYDGNNLTQRIYETILANTITFIDESFDNKKMVYGKANDFFYVKNRSDVIEKIKLIKQSSAFLNDLREIQYKCIRFDTEEYAYNFSQLIKDNI